MTAWMLATIAFSAIVAIAAAIGDRVAEGFALPRRFLWMSLSLIVVVIPASATTRHTMQPDAIVVDQEGTRPQRDAAFALRGATSAASDAPIALAFPRSIRPSLVASFDRVVHITRAADRWAVIIWIGASLALLVRLVVATARVRRDRRLWVERVEVVGPVLLAPTAGPAATGVIRPCIVMPRWMLDEDVSTRTLLLRHEAEHVRAGDTRTLFGAALLQVLFPWNPALHWMLRRLRLAIEIDCDHRVIRAVGSAPRYGLALLSASARHTARLPVSACLTESATGIERRIHAMTLRRTRRPLAGSFALFGIATLAIAVGGWIPWPTVGVDAPASVSTASVVQTPAPARAIDATPRLLVLAPAPASSRLASQERNDSAASAGERRRVDSSAASGVARTNTLSTAASIAASPATQSESLPSMRVVRDWIAQHHPNVIAGDPRVNRVTIVVDTDGRYLTSVADSEPNQASRVDAAFPLRGARRTFGVLKKGFATEESPGGAASVGAVAPAGSVGRAASNWPRKNDLRGEAASDPSAAVGVDPKRVVNMMLAHSRAGAFVPFAVSIVVLQVRGPTA